jgi:hypothetical protein
MLHPSTQQLIRKLCELTDAGHIAWKEGERHSSRFDSEGYVVEVEAEPPTLRLLRGDGRELERADAADLAATAWPDGQGTYATHVADMAAKANRVARGAEDAIARILTSLSAPSKQETPPAPPPHAAPPPEPVRVEAPRPAPVVAPPAPAQVAPVAVAPAAATPKAAFGSVDSFDKAPAPTAAATPPAPAKPAPAVAASAPPTFMIKGFSARSVQTPDSATIASATAPTPRPPEKKPELPPAVSVYKPWN